ncbi:hypothetical protein [Cupriavidus sp. SK-4]|uniref:hypothetical protein n=1 Tax=Cupriavidus sp. SK-4 TaxID=574750 RepID=UPI0012695790|nr:hypothetical protein [Cupriavidus sp. SK-4]
MQANVTNLVVDREAVEIAQELLRKATAGELCGLAFVARTVHRGYEFVLTGNFKANPLEAAGAAGLLSTIAEQQAIERL